MVLFDVLNILVNSIDFLFFLHYMRLQIIHTVFYFGVYHFTHYFTLLCVFGGQNVSLDADTNS